MTSSSLIVPHHPEWQRHTDVPYLWRARCACGWTAMAGTEAIIKLACRTHIESEEPFPYDLTPEDPSHGREE